MSTGALSFETCTLVRILQSLQIANQFIIYHGWVLFLTCRGSDSSEVILDDRQSRTSSLRSKLHRLDETSDSRKFPYKIDIDWFHGKTTQLAESKIPRRSLVIHLKADHAQLSRKSAISVLQIGSFQGHLLVSRPLVKRNKDPGYEGGRERTIGIIRASKTIAKQLGVPDHELLYLR